MKCLGGADPRREARREAPCTTLIKVSVPPPDNVSLWHALKNLFPFTKNIRNRANSNPSVYETKLNFPYNNRNAISFIAYQGKPAVSVVYVFHFKMSSTKHGVELEMVCDVGIRSRLNYFARGRCEAAARLKTTWLQRKC